MDRTRWIRFCVALLGLAIGVVAAAAPTVTQITLVSEKRIARTVFEYSYRITVKNDAVARDNVVATLSKVGTGTSIVVNQVNIGSLATNEVVTPADTVTIQHDRSVAFQANALVWLFSSSGPTNVTVPNVVGQTQTAATTAITNAGLVLGTVTQASNNTVPLGSVISQNPIAGVSAARGASVSLVVSNGSPPVVGILLPGSFSDVAIDHVPDFDAPPAFSDVEYSTDTSGAVIVRTLIAIGFRDNATVGQVNSLLNQISGLIVFSLGQTSLIYVRVPDPGSLVSLRSLLAQVRLHPVVDVAIEDEIPSTRGLPDSVPQPPASEIIPEIEHHLAIRAHAAWNARRALAKVTPNSGPVLIVADLFGAGNPFLFKYALNFTNDSTNQVGFANTPNLCKNMGDDCDHGYHVLGILAANFDDFGAASSVVTGIYPAGSFGALQADVIDMARFLRNANLKKAPALYGRIAQRIKTHTKNLRNVVVNTSIGNNDQSTKSDPVVDNWQRTAWLKLIRGKNIATPAPMEKRYFHAAAAGNTGPGGGVPQATHNAGWNTAVANGDLKNTAVVENRAMGKGQPPMPDCLSTQLNNASYTGGNVSAIGSRVSNNFFSGVVSYDRNTQLKELTGTSMAAPQVAGLAAYLWAIRPDLDSEAILSRVSDNTRAAPTHCNDNGQDVIDAYATILTADSGESEPTAPVRLAILDVNDDGHFNELDLQLFVPKLSGPRPQTRDYSRFDLNGDGLPGGPTRERFNLNMDLLVPTAFPGYQVLSRQIGIDTLKFDEKNLTDADILCYYSYGPLYTGSAVVRDNLLKDLCKKKASLSVPDLQPGWIGLPANIELTTLTQKTVAALQINGTHAFCTATIVTGERGVPLYSNQVDPAATFYAVADVTGVPELQSAHINRDNCSSFVAVRDVPDPTDPTNPAKAKRRTWINATARAFQVSGTLVRDLEYQIRYDSGDPHNNFAGKRCDGGRVPNGNVFSNPPLFTSMNCTHTTNF